MARGSVDLLARRSVDPCFSASLGEVVDVWRENNKLELGDRVVVSFTIICGECDQCQSGNFSVCERTNRNKDIADKVLGPVGQFSVRSAVLLGARQVIMIDNMPEWLQVRNLQCAGQW